MIMLRQHPFLLSVALLLVAGVVAFPIAWGSDVVVTKVNLDHLPQRILGVQGRDHRFDESVYTALNADYNVLREYHLAGVRSVSLYIGYYGTAKGGRPEHLPRTCYIGQGFSVVEWNKVPAPHGAGGMINKMVVKRSNDYRLVLFWFQSKDKVLADGIEQNLLRFKNRLLYNRDDGAFVRLSTRMSVDDEAEALTLVQDFAGELLRLLPAYWPEEG